MVPVSCCRESPGLRWIWRSTRCSTLDMLKVVRMLLRMSMCRVQIKSKITQGKWKKCQDHVSHVYIWHGNGINQGFPTPGPQMGTGPWPVRKQAAQQEERGRRVSKASLSAPHCSPSHLLTLFPEPSVTFLPESSHLPHPWQKLSSTKLVPDAKNVGDCCSRSICVVTNG